MIRPGCRTIGVLSLFIILLSGNSVFAGKEQSFEFQLQNRKVVMGADLDYIKLEFPSLKKSIGSRNSYMMYIDERTVAHFDFKNNKLNSVSIGIPCINDIEPDVVIGKAAEFNRLSDWITNTYGIGKTIKKKNELGEMLIKWKVGKTIIAKEAYNGPDGEGLSIFISIKYNN
jgi:hypothetical protein